MTVRQRSFKTRAQAAASVTAPAPPPTGKLPSSGEVESIIHGLANAGISGRAVTAQMRTLEGSLHRERAAVESLRAERRAARQPDPTPTPAASHQSSNAAVRRRAALDRLGLVAIPRRRSPFGGTSS